MKLSRESQEHGTQIRELWQLLCNLLVLKGTSTMKASVWALMHRRGLAFNLNAEVWRLIANSSHRVSSLFLVRELHIQAGFPLREEVKGNNSSYHAFRAYVFLISFIFFHPGWHMSLGAKPTLDTQCVKVTHCWSLLVTGSTDVEESKNRKCKLIASKEVRAANASCSVNNLGN